MRNCVKFYYVPSWKNQNIPIPKMSLINRPSSPKEGHVSRQEVTNLCNFFPPLKDINNIIMFLFKEKRCQFKSNCFPLFFMLITGARPSDWHRTACLRSAGRIPEPRKNCPEPTTEVDEDGGWRGAWSCLQVRVLVRGINAGRGQ